MISRTVSFSSPEELKTYRWRPSSLLQLGLLARGVLSLEPSVGRYSQMLRTFPEPERLKRDSAEAAVLGAVRSYLEEWA